jgi:uncharacterized membrane protein
MALITGLAMQVMWLTFAVFHLALAVIALALIWWYHVSPERIAAFLASMPESLTVQWLGLGGISATAVFFLYVKVWRRCFARVLSKSLFRPLHEAANSTN